MTSAAYAFEGALSGFRIAMATSGHPPLDDRIFFKEARSLAKAGADVTLIYSDAHDTVENTEGVRFATYPGGGSLRRRVRTVRRLEEALEAGGYHVIHCHEPDVLLAALRVKRRSGVKVIYDSHEVWGAVAAGWFPQPLWSTLETSFKLVERRLIRQCDGAIGASWDITDYLASTLGADRVITVLNVPVVDVFGEAERPKPPPEPLLVCHDGTLTFKRGLTTMAEAVRLVAAEKPIRFRIVGDVFGEERAWLDGFIATHGLHSIIERTGWLPYQEVGHALAPCHVGLSALQLTPNNIVTSSNKVFNYLLYGMPFIGPDFRHSKQRMAREDGCGLLADSKDPRSYANAIRSLIDDPALYAELAHRAEQASREKYRWCHMEPLLWGLYRRVLGNRADPSMAATG